MPTDGPPRDDNPLRTPEATRDRLVDLRDRFRWLSLNAITIKACLIQYTSDREGQGVTGWPTKEATRQFIVGLPSQLGAERLLELHALVDPARMPQFSTDRSKLQKLARRGGTIVQTAQLAATLHRGTLVNSHGDAGLWWSLLFQTAWNGKSALLKAERQIWESHSPLAREHGTTIRYPWDLGFLELHAKAGVPLEAAGIPANWLENVPDCFVSELDDAAQASADLCDILLAELDSIAAAQSSTLADTDATTAEEIGHEGLPPAARKAYSEYEQAAKLRRESGNPRPTDREVYYTIYDAYDAKGLACKLPTFDTWSRNLRTARKHYGTPKNTSRRGREAQARSVVSDRRTRLAKG
jgi:hypothetical protein